jgi:hypothetical protein
MSASRMIFFVQMRQRTLQQMMRTLTQLIALLLVRAWPLLTPALPTCMHNSIAVQALSIPCRGVLHTE